MSNQLTESQLSQLAPLLREYQYRWSLRARDKQKLPPGDWLTWLIRAGRGFGKMLDIDTDIPTTKGWKNLSTIKSGDYVYNLNGNPVKVLTAHPITLTNGYELSFDTGEKIKACKDHLWYTVSKLEDKQIRRGKLTQGSVKTTQQIVDSIKYLKRETNHRIPICLPIQLDDANLLIHPYLLGIWLGDGTSANAEIACNDSEIIQRIISLGYTAVNTREIQYLIGSKESKRHAVTGQFKSNGSFHSNLRSLNLIKNKHIPSLYLESSQSQRLELLRGLMDSDGYCEKTGHCEFVSIRKDLADNVFELISSLGIKARMYDCESRYYGKLMGRKYRIFFKTDLIVFHLDRKKQRQINATSRQMTRHKNRFIVKAEPIDKCLMRCLTVDSDDGLFLITKSLIATHNTRTGAETVRIWKENYPIIHIIGRTAADARDVLVEGESGILRISPKNDRPKYEPSKRRLTWSNGSRAILFSGEEPDSLRGPQCYKAWCDELAHWMYMQATWDMMQLGLRLGDNPQCVVTTTPKPFKLIREISESPDTHLTVGSTYENEANLSPKFIEFITNKYAGSPLGRQEIEAELLEQEEGAIFKNTLIVDDMPKDYKRLAFWLDFGFSNDPTSIGELALNNGELYADEMVYEKGLTNVPPIVNGKPDMLDTKNIHYHLRKNGVPMDALIIADSAEPKSIEELYRMGWNIQPAPKGPDSVRNGINIILRFIVNITKRSKGLLSERNLYKWAEDKEGNRLQKPVKGNDHSWDGIRYVCLAEIGDPIGKIISVDVA